MKEYFVWLLKLITLVVIFFVIVPVLMLAVLTMSEESMQQVGDKKNMVAVVMLEGVITDSREVVEELHRQAQSEKIKGIVLRIDSPGGAVGPSEDIYHAVRALKEKKPIVASMGAVAASGGLYSAVGATKVFAQPGTITGSIGVILQIPNFQGIASKVGFDMITIKSGALKDAGNAFRSMTAEERTYLERIATTAHAGFIEAVAEGRGIEKSRVLAFADGRIVLGSEAKKLGLIDEFGDVYAAARAVFDVLGTPLPAGEYPSLHYPQDKFKELRDILSSASTGLRQFLRPLDAASVRLEYLLH